MTSSLSKEETQRRWGVSDYVPPQRAEFRRAKLLRQAAIMNDVPEVTRLLFDGVVASARDETGRTALHHAITCGCGDVIDFLAQMPNTGRLIEAKDTEGKTALHIAAHIADPDTVKLLLLQEANVNCQDNDHWTPLHYAAAQGHMAVLEILIDEGKAKTTARDRNAHTAIDVARRNHKVQCERFLVQKTEQHRSKERWADSTKIVQTETSMVSSLQEMVDEHTDELKRQQIVQERNSIF